MSELSTKPRASLQGEQLKALEALEAQASKDDKIALNGVLKRPECRVALYCGENLVGFYSPFQYQLKGQTYWRCAPVYLDIRYRGFGYMSQVLQTFFEEHQPGLVFIAKSNKASLKMFVSLGFSRHSPAKAANGEEGYWFTNRMPEPNVPDAQDYEMVIKPSWLFW